MLYSTENIPKVTETETLNKLLGREVSDEFIYFCNNGKYPEIDIPYETIYDLIFIYTYTH